MDGAVELRAQAEPQRQKEQARERSWLALDGVERVQNSRLCCGRRCCGTTSWQTFPRPAGPGKTVLAGSVTAFRKIYINALYICGDPPRLLGVETQRSESEASRQHSTHVSNVYIPEEVVQSTAERSTMIEHRTGTLLALGGRPSLLLLRC